MRGDGYEERVETDPWVEDPSGGERLIRQSELHARGIVEDPWNPSSDRGITRAELARRQSGSDPYYSSMPTTAEFNMRFADVVRKESQNYGLPIVGGISYNPMYHRGSAQEELLASARGDEIWDKELKPAQKAALAELVERNEPQFREYWAKQMEHLKDAKKYLSDEIKRAELSAKSSGGYSTHRVLMPATREIPDNSDTIDVTKTSDLVNALGRRFSRKVALGEVVEIESPPDKMAPWPKQPMHDHLPRTPSALLKEKVLDEAGKSVQLGKGI